MYSVKIEEVKDGRRDRDITGKGANSAGEGGAVQAAQVPESIGPDRCRQVEYEEDR